MNCPNQNCKKPLSIKTFASLEVKKEKYYCEPCRYELRRVDGQLVEETIVFGKYFLSYYHVFNNTMIFYSDEELAGKIVLDFLGNKIHELTEEKIDKLLLLK